MKKIILDEKEVKQCVQANMLIKDMSSKFGCSAQVIRQNLEYYGLDYTPPSWKKGKQLDYLRQHPEIDKDWLIENWIDTDKSLSTLASEFGVSESLLEYRVHFYRLTKPRKYKIDCGKLFNIKDPEIWYLAGLIATDGYLKNNADTIDISLVGSDENRLLNDINEYLDSRHPLRTRGKISTLVISAEGVKEFFNKNFDIPLTKKTYTLKTPSLFISEDCIKAYILGSLDGDGSISSTRSRIRLVTASEDYIDGMITLINKYSGVTANKYIVHRKNASYPGLAITGKNKCRKFLTWLYSYKPRLYLERKYLESLKIINSNTCIICTVSL